MYDDAWLCVNFEQSALATEGSSVKKYKYNSKIQYLNCRVWKIQQVGFAVILQVGSCLSK